MMDIVCTRELVYYMKKFAAQTHKMSQKFVVNTVQCKLHSGLRAARDFESYKVIINSLPHLGSANKPKLRSETHTDMRSKKGLDMSKLTVTNFSKRTGSPFQSKEKDAVQDEKKPVVHEEVLQKTHQDKQKEKNKELQQKITKKTAEYQSNKPRSGTFTEIVTHGVFTSKKVDPEPPKQTKHEKSPSPPKGNNGTSSSRSLLGFPSSANDLALDAKSDLESDKNISTEVKEKVIEKIFMLVSMVQHVYESKVRIMTEFERFKDTHLKNEVRREKEHSEQLYKLNMNFQNEVIQAVQQLKSELDFSRNITTNVEEGSSSINNKTSSMEFNIASDQQCFNCADNINDDTILLDSKEDSDKQCEQVNV